MFAIWETCLEYILFLILRYSNVFLYVGCV